MEPNTDTGIPTTPVVNNKQKSGNGLKIATAIACVIAICGIGFGVYGMMQSSQKDNQISTLNSEITELKQSIEEFKNTLANTNTDTDNTTTETSDTSLIIDKWKLRIKLPESFSSMSYVLDNESSVSITASLKNDEQETATVGLVKADKTAVESGNTQWTSLSEAVFLDDSSAYFLMYTNTTPERDLTIDKQIINALSDSTLYSKI